jgi:membrane-associated protein
MLLLFSFNPIDFILHVDRYLNDFVAQYQTLTYVLLFAIIFCETGLVATPFLPGDSLLFAAGAVTASTGQLNLVALIILLIVAALLGDNVNYFMGRFVGEKVFDWKLTRKIVKRSYLEKAQAFYEKNGGKTIIMARFIPIVRTFAPFTAGLSKMQYIKYLLFCIGGAILWVTGLTLVGYFFGNLPWVKANFEKVIFGIIGISVLPMVIAFVRSKMAK